MIFIDKSTNKVLGDQVVKDYLDNCCLDTVTGRYSNVCYDKRDGCGKRFSSTNMGIYKKRMIDAIYRNQHGYCCYCLRKLNKKASNGGIEKISLEHIIPRGYDNTNNARLADYQAAPNLNIGDVILREDFERNTNQDTPPYPHNVAYNNLVASCLGNFPDEKMEDHLCVAMASEKKNMHSQHIT